MKDLEIWAICFLIINVFCFVMGAIFKNILVLFLSIFYGVLCIIVFTILFIKHSQHRGKK